MEFKFEILGSALWMISALVILTSILGSMIAPLMISVWNLLQTVSFGIVAVALFFFSIGLADKNKDLSQLALAASVCSIVLFVILFFSDPTLLFVNQGFISKTVTPAFFKVSVVAPPQINKL